MPETNSTWFSVHVRCYIFLETLFCQVEGLLNNGPGYSSLLGKISDFRWNFFHQVIHNTGSQSHTKVIQTLIQLHPSLPTLNFTIFASGVCQHFTQSTFYSGVVWLRWLRMVRFQCPSSIHRFSPNLRKKENISLQNFYTVWFTKHHVPSCWTLSYDALVQKQCLGNLA